MSDTATGIIEGPALAGEILSLSAPQFIRKRARRRPTAALAREDWPAERDVAYKQLGDDLMCDAIPNSAAGKVLRRVLRAQDASRDESV